MTFRLLSAAALLALLGATPVIAAAEPVQPAATGFRLGSARLFALRDALNVVPNDGSVFGIGVDPKAVGTVLAEAGAPADKITLSVDALLVRSGGRTVLIDTGLGPRGGGGALIPSLALAGVSPDEVTDVLITHSHPDHVGGLVRADGTPAFPNATIRMSRQEWAAFQARGNKALLAAIRAKVSPFDYGTIVVPGIRSVALPGHTPGHSGYEISAGRAHLLDMGDTAHSAIVSLAHPEWAIEYDGDAAQGRATREAELARLAASHERIFSPHFPYPGAGYVAKDGAGYRWQPALP